MYMCACMLCVCVFWCACAHALCFALLGLLDFLFRFHFVDLLGLLGLLDFLFTIRLLGLFGLLVFALLGLALLGFGHALVLLCLFIEKVNSEEKVSRDLVMICSYVGHALVMLW